ncbi:ATP-binding protein [Lentzea tibetensis]|uniref:ATP-binding protein n=1 Tax=Lentzea tibetensis TaxID=2591470 RepID=A0A563EY79_9PSEU|nr:tetratricopeptide repeat protein [Lentzea tibetensis]TWP52498.1 ATP-binding protein [Lentzea tibetensis]
MADDAQPEAAPDPSAVRTVQEFANQLRLLKIWAGNPSLRQLERRSGLPRSTVADALNVKRHHLPSFEVLRGFVRACGVTDQDAPRWEAVWRRLQAGAVAPPEQAAPSVSAPRQLPAVAAGFVGRTRDLKELNALLEPAGSASGSPSPGITIISGTAGVGKTALALHWAHQVVNRFPDGQLYLNLRGYSPDKAMTPEQALALLLRALGVSDENIPVELDALVGMYRSVTSGKRVLVLLDNASDVARVRPLVPGGRECLTLVTSRDRLTGLVAREGAHRLALEVLTSEEAPALLIAVLGPERVLREEAAAAELARLCGYLPLALRIAAAKLIDSPQQTVESYVSELAEGNRLAALAVEDDEETAVKAAFDLSYAALDPLARRLFRWIGMAPGPELTASAAAALTGSSDSEADRLLRTLAGAHLVELTAQTRCGQHDLLRLYANERAQVEDEAPVRDAALRRLHGWYLHTAIAAVEIVRPDFLRLPAPPRDPDVRPLTFADDATALTWLDAERVNLAAVIHSAAARGHGPVAWLLADALRGYYWLRRSAVDWLAVAQAGLGAAESGEDLRAVSAMHLSLGTAHWSVDDHRAAAEHFQRAVEISRQGGDRLGEISALGNLGSVCAELGALDRAADCHLQELGYYQEQGDTPQEARALGNLGLTCLRLGRLAEAAAHLEAAVAMRRAAGELHRAANALGTLGVVYRYLGRLESAAECLSQAQHLNHAGDARVSEAVALDDLARLHRDAGRPGPALDCAEQALGLTLDSDITRIGVDVRITVAAVREDREGLSSALRTARQIGHQHGEADALIELAASCLASGDLASALDHAQESLVLARDLGHRILQGQALKVLADIHFAGGEHSRAAEAGREAIEIHRRTGYRLGLARTLLTHGRALSVTEGLDAAQLCWQEALEVFDEVGTPEAGEVRGLLAESVRDRPSCL